MEYIAVSYVVGSLFDALIATLTVLYAIRGHRIGVVRQITCGLGFFGGLFMGAQLVPFTVFAVTDRGLRSLITLVTITAVGVIVAYAGDKIGLILHKHIRNRQLHSMGAGFGAVVNSTVVLLGTWYMASMFLASPISYLGGGLQRSVILRVLDIAMPPAPDAISHLQSVIDPNGMPQVFVGLEEWPVTNPHQASQSVIDAVVALDGTSTVRIAGMGCGGIVNGSGFVVAPDLVMTTAHIVAGIDEPVVIDQNGFHTTIPVYFDPDHDIALLKTRKLKGKPLQLAPAILEKDTPAVVLGYPKGGPFTGEPAAVTSSGDIAGRNIYGQEVVTRSTYTITAPVQPGNSGGPLVQADGTVIGMVYARSLVDNNVGYALTSPTLANVVANSGQYRTRVSTGACPAK